MHFAASFNYDIRRHASCIIQIVVNYFSLFGCTLILVTLTLLLV